tara:strand:- start:545 stop:1498 length:954 start_codon:yes stop_codon:yes gene_type:complete
LAGSHNGLLVSWDSSSGSEKWRVSITGPISDISLDSDIIYVTASDSLHAVDQEEGSILWSKQLEGASDYVLAVDGIVWATSSVYELEVADFIESAIWRFDCSGNELGRWVMAERPWHIASDGSDGILLGLGRPRCGYVRVSPKLGIEHIQLPSNSPVTCGSGNDTEVIFGHADGSVSALEDSIIEAESLVTSIASSPYNWISGHEDGSISMKAKSEILPGSIDSVEIVETIGWASSFDGLSVQIMILGEESNTIFHDSRVRHMDSSSSGIVLGDDQGRVYFVESGVMQRRLDSQTEGSEYDSKDSELRARLRMLRNR